MESAFSRFSRNSKLRCDLVTRSPLSAQRALFLPGDLCEFKGSTQLLDCTRDPVSFRTEMPPIRRVS
jgi:hypothetical protein